MAAIDTSTSIANLVWERDGCGKKTFCSGVVCHKNDTGVFILSTCHQIDDLIEPLTYHQITYDSFTVIATLFDGKTRYYGRLFALNRYADLAITHVLLPKEVVSAPPLSLVSPAILSKDQVYRGQEIHTRHHPAMDHQNPLVFQQSWGQIIAPTIVVPNMPTRVHFYMPLVMSGSSGAPIFDKNSGRLLAIVAGSIIGTTGKKKMPTQRLCAISRDTIENFLRLVDLP